MACCLAIRTLALPLPDCFALIVRLRLLRKRSASFISLESIVATVRERGSEEVRFLLEAPCLDANVFFGHLLDQGAQPLPSHRAHVEFGSIRPLCFCGS